MERQKDELEIYDDLHLADVCAEVPGVTDRLPELREPISLAVAPTLGERAILTFHRHKVLTAVGTAALGVAVGGAAVQLRHH